MAHIKLLIMGLPGSGKTTLAQRIVPLFDYGNTPVLFDGDQTRMLWPELGFSRDDRIEQARRMGGLCDLVNRQGFDAIASFVCPTDETRAAFAATHTIWIDRIKAGRFEDTNRMFVPPSDYDVRLISGTVDDWIEIVKQQIFWRQNETAFYFRAAS